VDPGTIVRLEGLGQLKKFNDLTRNRTRDLPAYSVVPRLTTLPSHRGGPVSNPFLVMWDFVMDKRALGQVFSEYFGFLCQSFFHRFLHNHPHLLSGPGTIGQ
jgi:hypothetical protein